MKVRYEFTERSAFDEQLHSTIVEQEYEGSFPEILEGFAGAARAAGFQETTIRNCIIELGQQYEEDEKA